MIFVLSLIFSVASAQQNQSTHWRDKVFFGGSFGLQFGDITMIDVSPLVGYQITTSISAGVSGVYKYYNNSVIDYSTHIYGGSVFGQLSLFRDLFAHFEVEPMNMSRAEIVVDQTTGMSYLDEKARYWVTSVLAGGGYRMRVGQRASLNMMVLWNLNETSYSPYQNPIVRIGFTF